MKQVRFYTARVISGNDASRMKCPLIHRTQTSVDAFCMSASGHTGS
jgi:hypothetical protein